MHTKRKTAWSTGQYNAKEKRQPGWELSCRWTANKSKGAGPLKDWFLHQPSNQGFIWWQGRSIVSIRVSNTTDATILSDCYHKYWIVMQEFPESILVRHVSMQQTKEFSTDSNSYVVSIMLSEQCINSYVASITLSQECMNSCMWLQSC